VRRQGVVRRFDTVLTPTRGPAEPVEVAATLLTEGDQERIGFTLHRHAPGAAGGASLPPGLREGLERLVAQLGELPLAALVSEASALAEKHFVALALQRTGGDASAAAAMLGTGRDPEAA
jgi:gamma-glutamyltranspeptidase